MTLAVGFISLGAVLFLVMQFLTTDRRRISTQIKRASSYAIVDQREKELDASAKDRLLAPMAAKFASFAVRISPAGNRVLLAKKLQAAGVKTQPQRFLAIKGGLILSGLVVGFMGAIILQIPALMAIGIGFSALAFIGPDMYLGRKARGRRDEMGRLLPDTLDLLTVSVEAGLGFDSAIGKVVEKMDGPLVEEFAIMAREIRIGESRKNALRNLGERASSPEVQSFARSIIQAEELGTSLGRTLRVQAQDMRIKRQLAAEEKAMKAPVKMMFPTVLFIFPAMFIVILGPAFLNITASLGPQ
jgi:tight adherence protein C